MICDKSAAIGDHQSYGDEIAGITLIRRTDHTKNKQIDNTMWKRYEHRKDLNKNS
jgi:hypothetical protein